MRIAHIILAFVASVSLSSPLFAAEVGSEVLLPASPLPAHEPAVAKGKAGYLVVWQSGRAENGDIYGCRLDDSGKAVDAKPFLISGAKECQERPRVSWGRDSWLVVWADMRNDKDPSTGSGQGYDVYAARVSAEGKVLDPDGIAVAQGTDNQCNSDVSWNNESWLVVWRHWLSGHYGIRAARVSAEGRCLDQQALALSEGAYDWSAGEPSVAACGGKWLVAWTMRRASRARRASDNDGTFLAVVSPDGKASASRLTKDGMAPAVIAANEKGEALVSWTNYGAGRGMTGAENWPESAIRVSSEGKSVGNMLFGGPGVAIRQPTMVWDGKGYVLFGYHGVQPNPKPVNVVYAHLIAEDGKYEGKVDVVPDSANPPFAPAACGAGDGKSLVVYERHPEKAGDPILIAAKLIKR